MGACSPCPAPRPSWRDLPGPRPTHAAGPLGPLRHRGRGGARPDPPPRRGRAAAGRAGRPRSPAVGCDPPDRLPLLLRDRRVGHLRPAPLDQDPRRHRPPARDVRPPPGPRGDRPRPCRRPRGPARPRCQRPLLARRDRGAVRGALPAAVGRRRAGGALPRRRRLRQLPPSAPDRAALLAAAPLPHVPLVRGRHGARHPLRHGHDRRLGVVELRRRNRGGRLPDRLPDRARRGGAPRPGRPGGRPGRGRASRPAVAPGPPRSRAPAPGPGAGRGGRPRAPPRPPPPAPPRPPAPGAAGRPAPLHRRAPGR